MINDVINRYWYSISWDVPSLWLLDLPVHVIPLEELIWQLDVPVWPDSKNIPYTTTPNQVLQSPVLNQREYARILKADLSFPIEVFRLKQRLMVLDGIHRLARTIMDGRTEIPVRFVPESAIQQL